MSTVYITVATVTVAIIATASIWSTLVNYFHLLNKKFFK